MKKVIYILNLLFLTLLVFGGSVFAAGDPPKQYILADGTLKDVPTGMTPLSTVVLTSGNNKLNGGWYYLDESITNTNGSVLVQSGAEVNIIVVGNPKITFTQGAIFVPKGASLNFWAESNNGTDDGVSLQISNVNNALTNFVIGNNKTYSSDLGYTTSEFGDIVFNSGSYTVRNNNYHLSNPISIGSPDSGGGSITVNSEAVVNASMNVSNGGTAIGTLAEEAKCSVTVKGGLLNTTFNKTNFYGIDVGTGSLTVENQGRVLTASTADADVPELVDGDIWDIQSGVVGYCNYLGTTDSLWNAIVNGNITVPNPDSDISTDDLLNLTVPDFGKGGGSNGFWNSVTVLPNGNLTLGATNNSGTLVDASFRVGGTGSYVDSYGTVTINAIDQNGQYPWSWNNNSGSDLTIASGATLGLWAGNFVNLAADSDSGEPAGQVTIDGKLNFNSTGNFQNDGNATLDGNVTFTNANRSFQNNGTLDIGPIGTVSGGASTNLINYEGGTVTSQNPCYYGNQVNLLISRL